MWLQGRFFMSKDSPEVRQKLTLRIWRAVLSGAAVGAASFLEGQLLVTHAGVRPAMWGQLLAALPSSVGALPAGGQADAVADKLRSDLVAAAATCRETPPGSSPKAPPLACPGLARDPVYDAGPERGGKGVGGPYWTDFKILEAIGASEGGELGGGGGAGPLSKVTQVVGHSAADCDVAEWADCQPIRGTHHALAVDGAMYWGNRAYLELTAWPGSGGGGPEFISHTKLPDGTWQRRYLDAGRCGLPL
jgi:hypothetical protein